MIRSQVILLKPNKDQKRLFLGSAGLSRFAWNWALGLSQRYYRMFKKSLSSFTLAKHWNKVKHRRFSWFKEYSKYVPEASFANLEKAMKATFARLKKKKKGGFPRFKKRGVNDSFQVVPSNQFPLTRYGNKFRIPKIGKVRFQGKLRWPEGKQLTGRVKLRAGKWYLTLTYDLPNPSKLPEGRPSCGIDLGCKTFATVVSNGQLVQAVEPPKPYSKAKRRLRRLQRVVSRRVKGGSNRRKAVLRVAIAHKRVSDIRHDFLHQLTSRLTKQFGSIGLEDLSVSGMARGWLAGTIHDLGFYEFRRQIDYKSQSTGTTVVYAHRFYPSSKTCSSCGAINHSLKLVDRSWTCSCGAFHDRDVNAAINLEKIPQDLGKSTPTESEGSFTRKGKGVTRRSRNATCS